jgi:cell wall-associated NlpC family hydrolase
MEERMDINKILKPFIDFFGGIRIYWCGLVLWGDSMMDMKGPDMRQVLDTVKPGDLVLRRFDNYVSSFFIKGRFSHIGIYVGGNSVIHVGGDGIKMEDILTFCRADDFAIVRPVDENLIQPAIDEAHAQLARGVEYDYVFDTNSPEKFYCSEFTDYCYGQILKHTVSDDIVLPDDCMKSDQFGMVWEKK